jgi:hypothetical protein
MQPAGRLFPACFFPLSVVVEVTFRVRQTPPQQEDAVSVAFQPPHPPKSMRATVPPL